MNPKTFNTHRINQNKAVQNLSLQEKEPSDFIQPIYSRPFYFTVTSNVHESFIVDWQLDDK